MVLAFRKVDYEMMTWVAAEIRSSMTDMIVEACNGIGRDPNFYTNPPNMADYSEVRLLELDMPKAQFQKIVQKADFHNYSLELFIVQAVKTLKSMHGIEPKFIEEEAFRTLVHL